MPKHVRITVTALCLSASLLLVVLWVRSHRAEDRAQGRLSAVGIRLYSSRGWLVLLKNNNPGAGQYKRDVSLGSEYWLNQSDARLRFALPLSFFGRSAVSYISLPHWLLVLASITFAAAPWLFPWRPRFSLRALLIATTLVAMVLGIMAYSH